MGMLAGICVGFVANRVGCFAFDLVFVMGAVELMPPWVVGMTGECEHLSHRVRRVRVVGGLWVRGGGMVRCLFSSSCTWRESAWACLEYGREVVLFGRALADGRLRLCLRIAC
jgi:hypothetical protein